MTKIRYIPGIPHWFTWLHHLIEVRHCRKRGHQGAGPGGPVYICVECGQFLPPLDALDDPNAYVDESERRLRSELLLGED